MTRQPIALLGAGTFGYRSAIAAGLLQPDGLSAVADLVCGLAAWESAKRVLSS
jgi:hypothetical protein